MVNVFISAKNAIVYKFTATHDVDDCLMFNERQSYGFDCNHSCYYDISNFLKYQQVWVIKFANKELGKDV